MGGRPIKMIGRVPWQGPAPMHPCGFKQEPTPESVFASVCVCVSVCVCEEGMVEGDAG